MSIKKRTISTRYDEAFKAGVVKMVTEQGRPSKEFILIFFIDKSSNMFLFSTGRSNLL